MRTSVWRSSSWVIPVFGLLALAGTLGGCVPVVLGGAAVGATVVAQERSVSDAVDDSVIQAEVVRALFEFDVDVFQKVDTEVVEVARRRNIELWDNGWALAVGVLLVAFEWAIRRRRGYL